MKIIDCRGDVATWTYCCIDREPQRLEGAQDRCHRQRFWSAVQVRLRARRNRGHSRHPKLEDPRWERGSPPRRPSWQPPWPSPRGPRLLLPTVRRPGYPAGGQRPFFVVPRRPPRHRV